MPPASPFMPPAPPSAAVPPMPPAPADYTQQLFSYLQAWRQYLEQATGTRPESPQASTASGNHPANDGGKTHSSRPPDVPIPPDDDIGSKGIPEGEARQGSDPTWPPLVYSAPDSYIGSQIVGTAFDPDSPFNPVSPFDHGRDEPLVLNPPDYDFGYQFDGPRLRRDTTGPTASSPRTAAPRTTPQTPAQPRAGSPFLSAMDRADPTASPQVVPKSLFSAPGAQTAPERLGDAGQTPSP
jgi:hypothetical protein